MEVEVEVEGEDEDVLKEGGWVDGARVRGTPPVSLSELLSESSSLVANAMSVSTGVAPAPVAGPIGKAG